MTSKSVIFQVEPLKMPSGWPRLVPCTIFMMFVVSGGFRGRGGAVRVMGPLDIYKINKMF